MPTPTLKTKLRTRPLVLALALLAALPSLSRASAADGTPYPPEIASWTSQQKEAQRAAALQLLADIDAAVDEGRSTIVVPKGDYRFAEPSGRSPAHHRAHLVLSQLADTVIDFQGSTLWFETSATGVLLRKSSRVTLKNAVLDWDPLPFTQGRIEAIDTVHNALVVRLDPAYEHSLPDMQNDAYWRGAAFDPVTRRIKDGQIGWGVDFSWSTRQPDGTRRFPFRGFYNVRVADSELAPGDLVALWDRRGHGVGLEGNGDCVIENITLHSCPFIGFSENTGAGNTQYVGCRILPRPGTDRLLGGNADGFNVACVRQGPVIRSCEIDTIGDDFVNVHHYFSRVLWQEPSGHVIVSPIAYQGDIPGHITVEFFDRRTMAKLGERQATVQQVYSWEISPDRCLADLSVRWLAGGASNLVPGARVRVHRLALDLPLEITGDVIASSPDFGSPGAVIENNHFSGSLAKGLRLQSPHVTVRGNTLENTCSEAIALCSQPSRWGEGPYVTDALITGNTIRDTNGRTRSFLRADEPGEFAAAIRVEIVDSADPSRIQRRITIEDNLIEGTGVGAAIYARNAAALRITGNHIARTLPRSAAGPRGVPLDDARLHNAIVLEGVHDIDSTVSGNTIEPTGPVAQGAFYSQ